MAARPRPNSRSRDIPYSEHVDVPVQGPEADNVFRPGSPRSKGALPTDRSRFARPPKDLTPEESASIRGASVARDHWEATPEGEARTRDVSQLLSTQMKPAQIYAVNGWDQQTGVGPRHYDRQLPGMSDPAAAPRPVRWEEHSPETRRHIERALAAHGTSIDQMADDLGAQIDQANVRAAEAGHSGNPYAMDFYSTGEPRAVLDQSARDLGIPQPTHALMNAFTSPQTKFSQDTNSGRRYPNDEAARHVVEHVQGGGTATSLTNERTDGSGKRHQGFVGNMRTAATAMEMHLQGIPPQDWAGPSGDPMVGPKTGSYANSWSDSHPQFTVADVHTGGGGALPHLSSEKPLLRGESGEVLLSQSGAERRDKSEREKAIETIPYAHAAIDYAMRQAMQKRGLGSIRDSQATQWGEEQLQRGEAGLRSAPSSSTAYPTRPSGRRQIEGQIEAFPGV
jgi:hypothetical protein